MTQSTDDRGETLPAVSALAAELKRLQKSSGHTLGDLSDKVKYSRSALSRMLNGRSAVSEATALAITEALGGDADHIRELWRRAEDATRTAPVSAGGTDVPLRAVARALASERAGRGLSVRELSRAAGWGKTVVGDLFTGKKPPNRVALAAVLPAMGMTTEEVELWTTRFEEAAAQDSTPPPATDSSLLEEIALLRRRSRRAGKVAWTAAGLASAALILAASAWCEATTGPVDSYSGNYPTTTTTSPLPPGTITATVYATSSSGYDSTSVAVFKTPDTTAEVTTVISSGRMVVVQCQVTTEVPVTDPKVNDTTAAEERTWGRVSRDGAELGYVPKIYLRLDDSRRPVLQPPACS
ncbi:helix-turn-helix transcriptional regulator [Actinokineospora sp. NBRC 105648]|uniref:helix-turn-helix domain-containing protein n=1 Tax=Actinokineospora sp. NBRC 105648 TaxID=3032206 RepID=UPI0024A2CBCC|nr:helix-turn-helix transcriptional regulator [Actinokineospora sp. NBRC 105648]GLZ39878.1 hypothetical protein Acsp05_35020 [Actinokineospora sp. NBRC 105648]